MLFEDALRTYTPNLKQKYFQSTELYNFENFGHVTFPLVMRVSVDWSIVNTVLQWLQQCFIAMVDFIVPSECPE